MRKPRVLMIAFACNPAGNGEHWLGWGWAEQASQKYDVTLLTWDRFANEIQREAPSKNITPVCVGVHAKLNKIADRSGAGRWLRQIIWHHRANKIARELHRENPFDLVHQTTFHTFRIPFRAASWGIPSVWGPIAGGESTPPGFGAWLGRLKTSESLRVFFNRLALMQPGVQKSLRAVATIFVSNKTTLAFLPAWCRDKCIVVPPNANRGELPPPPERPSASGAPLKLLFVGNCVATRSMPLVFQAMQRIKTIPCSLTIVGGGSSLPEWKEMVMKAGMTSCVTFTGPVKRDALQKYYANADAFVFPALRDSGGSGLLEAMSLGLPSVCCNWGGPAEMVDDESGIRVSVETPDAAIQGFAAAFERLYKETEWRARLGANAFKRAQELFSWDQKRRLLEATYARCLGESL